MRSGQIRKRTPSGVDPPRDPRTQILMSANISHSAQFAKRVFVKFALNFHFPTRPKGQKVRTNPDSAASIQSPRARRKKDAISGTGVGRGSLCLGRRWQISVLSKAWSGPLYHSAILVQVLIGDVVLGDLMSVHFPRILIVGFLNTRHGAGFNNVSFLDQFVDAFRIRLLGSGQAV